MTPDQLVFQPEKLANTSPIASLFQNAAKKQLQPEEWLFKAGDPGNTVYLIEEGTLDVVITSHEGKEQTLARLESGAVVGEIAYLLGGERSAGVRAREQSTVLCLSRDTEHPNSQEETHALVSLIAKRLRSSNALVQDLLDEDYAMPRADIDQLKVSDTPGVLVRDQIYLDDVIGLLDGSILAVRIPGWYAESQSRRLCKYLLRHPGFSRYSIAADVGVQRIGYSYFETQGHQRRLDRYFAMAASTIKEVRNVCNPYLTPIDRLRLELDEVWPSGAGVASMDGKKMFAGVVRLFEDGHCLNPHQDVLSRETTHALAASLTAQLTANIYLRVPREGGELEVWNWVPTDEEAKQLYDGRYDFFDRAKLPAPAAAIRPCTGELVLMLSSRIHAVRLSQGGPRISMSCFIGHRSPDERLLMWN